MYCCCRVVQLLSCVQLFATPWTTAHRASLSLTIFQSLLRLMSIESVIPFNHLILYLPLILLPLIFPSIRVFSNKTVLPIRWPKYWSFSFSIHPSNKIQGWFPLGLIEFKELLRVFSAQIKALILQCSAFFMVQLSHPTWLLEKPVCMYSMCLFIYLLMNIWRILFTITNKTAANSCVLVFVCDQSLQSCLTSCNPIESVGFSRQEYWSGLPFPSLGDLPDPGIQLASLKSPTLAAGFFTTSITFRAPSLL